MMMMMTVALKLSLFKSTLFFPLRGSLASSAACQISGPLVEHMTETIGL